MLGKKYKDMYESYYNDEVDLKRHLTARETMTHIHKLIDSKHYDSIIDVGAGQGSLVELIRNYKLATRVSALEISASGIEKIKARNLEDVEIRRFDGYRTEFGDKEFDLALSIHVLEHVEHERLLLREIGRISKQAIIEVPLEHTMFLSRRIGVMEQYGHINFYTRDRFDNLLRTSGLIPRNIIVNTYSVELDKYLDARFGLIKNKIRKFTLAVNPNIAQFVFVYLCTALCDCE